MALTRLPAGLYPVALIAWTAGPRSTPMARLRVTSTSTSAMIPRSAPSGSTESSGKRPIELAMKEALRSGRDTSVEHFGGT